MDKQREIRSLTWKYFLEQKIVEVSPWFIVFLLSIICSFGFWIIVIYSGGDILPVLSDHIISTLFSMYFIGLLIVCFIGGILYIIYTLIFDNIMEWLKDNWREANQKAKREVNKKSK